MEKRANNFDFLRFVLALLVIYEHSFLLLIPGRHTYDHELFYRLTRHQMGAGEMAVDGFFAMSGFLIWASLTHSRSAWVFLQRRVARIYPGYLLAAAVCFLVFGPLAVAVPRSLYRLGVWAPYVFRTFGLEMIQLPGAFPHNPQAGVLNGSAWTILLEFWCYLFLLGAGLLGAGKRPVVLVGLLALFTGLFAFGGDHLALPSHHGGMFLFGIPLAWNGYWPRFLAFFLAGVCAQVYRDRLPWSRSALLLALGLVSVTCAAGWGLRWVAPVCLTYLLLRAAFTARLPMHRFAARGDFSYGFYLYAYPVQQTLVQRVHPLNPYTLCLLTLPLALLFAVASWCLVEAPVLRQKPR